MKLDVIKKESNILYQEIDECITELLKARGSHDTEAEGKALFKMEGLMVGTLQHLGCIMEAEDVPSNIDEAAEEIASDIAPTHPDIDWDECFEKIKDGIKAGAEWIAGQGIYADAEVCKLTERAWVTPINEKQLQRDLYDNFIAGDKVIVQIRKKQ